MMDRIAAPQKERVGERVVRTVNARAKVAKRQGRKLQMVIVMITTTMKSAIMTEVIVA